MRRSRKNPPPQAPPPHIFASNPALCLTFSFVLKDKGTSKDRKGTEYKERTTEKSTRIICYLSYNGLRLKYYIGEKINPKHWDDRKGSKKYQRSKGSFTEAPELNRRLDNIASTAKTSSANIKMKTVTKSQPLKF